MKINGVDISLFNAIQLNDDIKISESENSSKWNKNHINPIFDDNKFTFKCVDVTLLVTGTSKEEVKNNISNIVNLLRKKSVIELGHYKNNFIGIYESCSINKKSPFAKEVILTIRGYEESLETFIKISDADNHTINNVGTSITPCYLEIIPTFSYSSLTINGLSDDPIKVNNITANKKIIIDGYTNKITEDGINKFNDVELFEFPRLIPGNNTIKISDNRATLTVKWKERFI